MFVQEKIFDLYDGTTGRVKKIYAGLLHSHDDEITLSSAWFIRTKSLLLETKEAIWDCIFMLLVKCRNRITLSHSIEVTSMKVDYVNKLVITSSTDSTIFVQKELKLNYEIKRKVVNVHYQKEISLLEASVYHNIFITASTSNLVYIWDYEYTRLIGSVELEEGCEPTAIQFINGFAIMIISTNIGTIHFIHFEKDRYRQHFIQSSRKNRSERQKGCQQFQRSSTTQCKSSKIVSQQVAN